MGWCSGTEIFDTVCKAVLSDKPVDKEQTIRDLIEVLHYHDWDCESDSEFYGHQVVKKIFKELFPEWFEEN